ncbi:hypothetical protein EVAR_20273_1 [Eumeta japonica]|uniref:Uncharacterized protein n=1 Tax=Eumeta variegata TaxID=151549 RepID=A0A4C1VP02_EUMVA|nr:hypothetical protein EVAR_20273_1 [Eumeta japonica]
MSDFQGLMMELEGKLRVIVLIKSTNDRYNAVTYDRRRSVTESEAAPAQAGRGSRRNGIENRGFLCQTNKSRPPSKPNSISLRVAGSKHLTVIRASQSEQRPLGIPLLIKIYFALFGGCERIRRLYGPLAVTFCTAVQVTFGFVA